MEPWVDFQAVKGRVNMRMLLDHYAVKGLRSAKEKTELRGPCPIHKGAATERSFSVNLDRNIFRCFRCKASGNVLDLAAALEETSVRDAALILHKKFRGDGSAAPPAAPTIAASAAVNPPLNFQLRVDAEHEYGKSRGVSKNTLEDFGAGFSISRGTFAQRFLIPLHDASGALVGYAGRAIDDTTPEYLFPSEAKGFRRENLLFNLHRILQAGQGSAPVILVDDFFACMQLADLDVPAVSLLKNSLSEEQEILLGQLKQILIFAGSGGITLELASEYAARLARRSFVRVLENILIEEATPSRVLEALGW